MKSSIKIDFADRGNGIESVIKVRLIKSDDPRDALLQNFFEQLGGKSSWAKIYFEGRTGNNQSGYSYAAHEDCDNINIFPVKGTEEEIYKLFAESCQLLPPTPPSRKPDLDPFLIFGPINLLAGALSVNMDASPLQVDDEVIDETFTIGRVMDINKEKDRIIIAPVNVTAWDATKHFQPGTSLRVISRRY